jgi:uncharacterized membrane protein
MSLRTYVARPTRRIFVVSFAIVVVAIVLTGLVLSLAGVDGTLRDVLAAAVGAFLGTPVAAWVVGRREPREDVAEEPAADGPRPRG